MEKKALNRDLADAPESADHSTSDSPAGGSAMGPAGGSSETSKRGRRWTIFLVALLTIPATIFYNLYAITHQSPVPRSETVEVTPVVTTFEAEPASHRVLLELHGEALPRYEVTLVPEVGGRVVEVSTRLEPGATVRAGEVLLLLEDVDYVAAVAEARQAVADAELQLGQEQRQAEQALRDWNRAGFDQPATDLALRKPQMAAATARLEAARAALARAQDDLSDTRLKAPFDAVVADRSVAPGGFVAAGSSVATLYANDEMRVSVPLSDPQWQLISPQGELPEQVTLTSTTGKSGRWQARPVYWSGTVDRATRQRRLVVAVDRPLEQNPPLLPGTFVQVEVLGPMRSGLLRVPASAITAEGFLLFVDQDERLGRAPVNVLFGHDQHLFVEAPEAISQLGAATLVRAPLAGYLPGMKVRSRNFHNNGAGS